MESVRVVSVQHGSVGTPSTSPAQSPTTTKVELQQAELLAQKYGGMMPKKHLLARRHSNTGSRKRFDSADWAMKKAECPSLELPGECESPIEDLPAVLQPPETPLISRRSSNLGA